MRRCLILLSSILIIAANAFISFGLSAPTTKGSPRIELQPCGDTDLSVSSENIVFNVAGEPYFKSEVCRYGEVTSRYEFINNSDHRIKEFLAFEEPSGDVISKITVNGMDVPAEIRYTLKQAKGWSGAGDICDFFAGTKDELTPDLPVVKYSCLLKDVSIAKEASDNFGRYQNFRFVSTDGSTACFYHCSPECLRFDKPEENPITVFIAGDIGSVRILTEANTDITGRFEMKEKETVTLSKALRELLQKHFPEICETDSYNLFIKREWPESIHGDYDLYDIYSRDAAKWFRYEITADPGEHVQNEITIPLYPMEMHNYYPSVYSFEYYTSPAARFRSFGTLDVTVKTAMWIVEPGTLSGVPYEGGEYADAEFIKTDAGYIAHFDGLPKGELRFNLSEKKGNDSPSNNMIFVMAGVIGLMLLIPACIAVTIVVIVKKAAKAIKKE